MQHDSKLHDRVLWDSYNAYEELLKKSDASQINAPAQYTQRTPLHDAAADRRVEIVELLLRYGATIDARDMIGDTPLHAAAQAGHMDVADMLLRHGAQWDAVNKHGATPFWSAVSYNQPATLAVLQSYGADAYHVGPGKQRPMLCAAFRGHVDAINELVRLRVSADPRGEDEVPPLVAAAGKDFLEAVQVLLRHGATVDIAGVVGMTPLHIATAASATEIVRELLRHGANPAVMNGMGQTPLFYSQTTEMEAVYEEEVEGIDVEALKELTLDVEGMAALMEKVTVDAAAKPVEEPAEDESIQADPAIQRAIYDVMISLAHAKLYSAFDEDLASGLATAMDGEFQTACETLAKTPAFVSKLLQATKGVVPTDAMAQSERVAADAAFNAAMSPLMVGDATLAELDLAIQKMRAIDDEVESSDDEDN